MNPHLDNEIQQACELVSNCEAACKEADRRLYYAKEVLRGLKDQERRATQAALMARHEALRHGECEQGRCLELNGKGGCMTKAQENAEAVGPQKGRW